MVDTDSNYLCLSKRGGSKTVLFASGKRRDFIYDSEVVKKEKLDDDKFFCKFLFRNKKNNNLSNYNSNTGCLNYNRRGSARWSIKTTCRRSPVGRKNKGRRVFDSKKTSENLLYKEIEDKTQTDFEKMLKNPQYKIEDEEDNDGWLDFTQAKDAERFPPLIDKSTDKFNFGLTANDGVEYMILGSVTNFKGESFKRNKYQRNTRLFANNGFTKFNHYDSRNHNFNFEKLILNKYIIPSKINQIQLNYGQEQGNDYCFEKTHHNFAFRLIKESEINEDEKKMKFQAINKKNIEETSEVNLEEDIYLYSEDYKIYLSLNTEDENNLSCISNHNFKNKKKYCKLKMKMARITPEDDKIDFKLCYDSKPFQAVDFGKISISKTKCNEKDIKIGYTKLDRGDYYFCSKQENISKTNNDEFKKYDYSENEPFRPYPL